MDAAHPETSNLEFQAILQSQPEFDFQNQVWESFARLQFEHPSFKGTGRELLVSYLYQLGCEELESEKLTQNDYELFIGDVLGEDLFLNFFKPLDEQVNVSIEAMQQEHALLWNKVQAMLDNLSPKEKAVIQLRFGLDLGCNADIAMPETEVVALEAQILSKLQLIAS